MQFLYHDVDSVACVNNVALHRAARHAAAYQTYQLYDFCLTNFV